MGFYGPSDEQYETAGAIVITICILCCLFLFVLCSTQNVKNKQEKSNKAQRYDSRRT